MALPVHLADYDPLLEWLVDEFVREAWADAASPETTMPERSGQGPVGHQESKREHRTTVPPQDAT